MQMQPVVDLPGFIAPPKGALHSGPSESAASFSDVHDAIVASNSKNQKRSDLPADNPPTDPPKKNELVDKEEGRTATAGAAAIPAQPAQPAPVSPENDGAAPAADQSAPIQTITDPLLARINATGTAASLLTQPEPRADATGFTNLLQAAVTQEAVNPLGNPATTGAKLAPAADLVPAADLAPAQKTPADIKTGRPQTSEIPPGLTIAQTRTADPTQPAPELAPAADLAPAQKTPADIKTVQPQTSEIPPGLTIAQTRTADPTQPAPELAPAADLAPAQKTPADIKTVQPQTSEIPPGLTIAQARTADPAQPATQLTPAVDLAPAQKTPADIKTGRPPTSEIPPGLTRAQTRTADPAQPATELAPAADLAPAQKTPADIKTIQPPTSEIPPGLTIAQARAADPAQPALEKVILAKTTGHASAQEVATPHQDEGLHRGHAFARGQEVSATTTENPPAPSAIPGAGVKDNTVSLAMGKSFAELLGGQTAQGKRPPAPLHAKTDDSSPPLAPPENQVKQQASTRNSQLSTGQEENRGGNGDPANGGLVEKGLPTTTNPRSFSQELPTQNLTASQQQPSTAASTGSVQLPSGAVVTDQQVVSQVVTQLSIAIRPHGESNSITINLHPEELGRLKLELEVHKETVKAHLLAQTPQAQEILERHIPRLREALAQQGLRLDEIRIDVEAGLAGGSKGFQHESGGARFGFQPSTGPTPSIKPVDKTLLAKTESINWSNGQGGLSLRI